MAKHYDLGIKGEQVAALELEKNGYKILEKNWRYDRAEIDIIATKDNFLVIVEVKTRSSDKFGTPEESVDIKKENNLIRATEAYIEEKDIDMECRFDIMSLIINGDTTVSLKHFEDAFTPTVE
ncbi:MAG: YraN family protein [Flavobacteriales bacterium]|nr:YraN family protein [Flavobacteriales bacterium]